MDFINRIQPAKRSQFFKMDGYFVWDGSIIQDENGKFQLYASRWPAELGMAGWLTDSKIIRAEADSIDSPFEFKEELTILNSQSWAENMAHNPKIYFINGKYYLYYIGTHWRGADVEKARIGKMNGPRGTDIEHRIIVRFSQRTGIAVADKAGGPWTPYENNPILAVRPDEWDAKIIVNPSAHVLPNGKIQMIYKSTLDHGNPLILGAAVADKPEGPYERTGPSPLFTDNVEDPCIWFENGKYYMLVKDMTGDVCGIRHAGILYESTDSLNWTREEGKPAYTRELDWVEDGKSMEATFVERPQIILQDDKSVGISHAVLEDRESTAGVLIRTLK